ncbi:MAG: TetR/AcrR family transcriptional regulator [Planctomycetales bacterium]|nr:TetR/AcrR family transcriptional regulator [Planctomycetales bacterium]
MRRNSTFGSNIPPSLRAAGEPGTAARAAGRGGAREDPGKAAAGGRRVAAAGSRRALRTRLEILRGAAAAFRQKGFHGARLDDVAAALDRTKASLYYYFASKEELLYFCQEQTLARLLGTARRVRRERLPAAEALETLLAEHVVTLLDETAGGPAHLEVGALPAALRRRIVGQRDRYERAVRALVAKGQRAGAFAPGDPGLLARMALGAVNWTAQWYRPGERLTPSTIGQEMASRLVRGLRK